MAGHWFCGYELHMYMSNWAKISVQFHFPRKCLYMCKHVHVVYRVLLYCVKFLISTHNSLKLWMLDILFMVPATLISKVV